MDSSLLAAIEAVLTAPPPPPITQGATSWQTLTSRKERTVLHSNHTSLSLYLSISLSLPPHCLPSYPASHSWSAVWMMIGARLLAVGGREAVRRAATYLGRAWSNNGDERRWAAEATTQQVGLVREGEGAAGTVEKGERERGAELLLYDPIYCAVEGPAPVGLVSAPFCSLPAPTVLHSYHSNSSLSLSLSVYCHPAASLSLSLSPSRLLSTRSSLHRHSQQQLHDRHSDLHQP